MKQYVLLMICSLFIASAAAHMHDVDTARSESPHALLHNPLMQQLVAFLAETAMQDLSEEVHASVSRYMQSLEAEDDLLEEHDLAVIAQALLRRWDLVEGFIFDEIYKAPRPNTQTINNMVVGANNQCCNNLLTAASSSSSGGTCDLSGIITALDLLETALTTCCNTTNGNFVSTFTVIADITTTFTTCCAKLTTDFAGTWTMLAGLGGSTDTCGTFTPITSVPTILSAPGNYCLTQSFSVGAGQIGLLITGTRVYVDFNNYVLTLNDLNSSIGVSSSADQTTIANGMIVGGLFGAQGNNDIFMATNMTFSGQTNFLGAALSVTGTACSVSDCSFDTVNQGIFAQNTTALTISNCTLNNIVFGIEVENSLSFFIQKCALNASSASNGGGVVIINTSNGYVQNCLFQNLPVGGLGMVAASNIVVSDCMSNGCSQGFSIADSTNIALIRCQASNGPGTYQFASGIFFQAAGNNLSGVVIRDCISSSNVGSGLDCQTLTDLTIDTISIQNCIFSGNTLYGLHLLNTSSSVVNNCDFTANGTGCLIDSCFGVGIYHNSAANNTVDGFSLITSGSCIHRYNEASNNTEFGFFADSLSTTCTYYNNLAFNNNSGGPNNFIGINQMYGNVVTPADQLNISSTGSAQQLVYNVSAP